MENIKALREMHYKHPDLPVICVVDGEVVPEYNGCCWLAMGNAVRREKIWIGAEGVYYYDNKRVDEDAINDPNCVYPEMELTEERAKEVYDSLPWVECIVINIDTN